MEYKIHDAAFQRLAQLLVVCFLLVAIGAGYWSVIRAEGLYDEWDIRRQIERELSVERGRILAADGSVIVETQLNEQGRAERLYHYTPLSHVTGHWTIIYGKSGLERSFDDYLSGRRGQLGLDAFDELMHEQVVGADIVTTIRPQLQQKADELLGARKGAVIVMNGKTGAVLALSSYPYYDPNTYEENAETLVNDPNQPTLNRVTRGLYTPGSVFKVVTLAGALKQDRTTPGELFQNQTGTLIVEGAVVRDGSDLPLRNAPYDLAHALAWSSNVTFAQLGLRMGANGIRDITSDFGFGDEPPFELPTEASRVGSDESLFNQVGLADTGYGQGELLVTPLQMALVTAAVINDGQIREPKIVSGIRSRKGDTIAEYRAENWKRALSRRVAAQTREAMIISARDGFAQAGAPLGIAIGGKTGTAQLGGANAPHAWFIAFAPADDPKMVVAVIVENTGAGGDFAAPIARELIRVALGEP